MSLQSVENATHSVRSTSRRRRDVRGAGWVPRVVSSVGVVPGSPLTVATTGISRWYDPTSQHVTWHLRLTNAGEQPVADLTAAFDYVGSCGTPATSLSVSSRSTRRNALVRWSPCGSLAACFGTPLAAWETVFVTAVFASATDTCAGSVAVTFAAGQTGEALGTQSEVF